MSSVFQPWVEELSFMQQSVLMTAMRGPDGIQKNHLVKVLLRWYRRCIVYSAFEKKIFVDPYEEGGGSFTGPCRGDIGVFRKSYLSSVDELPHHFQLHFMHACEILGYKYPGSSGTREWWFQFYYMIVKDLHLNIETEEEMDKRLGDNHADWRAAEVVTAK